MDFKKFLIINLASLIICGKLLQILFLKMNTGLKQINSDRVHAIELAFFNMHPELSLNLDEKEFSLEDLISLKNRFNPELNKLIAEVDSGEYDTVK